MDVTLDVHFQGHGATPTASLGPSSIRQQERRAAMGHQKQAPGVRWGGGARLAAVFSAAMHVHLVSAHSSLIIPPSRNALIDAGNPKFSGGKSPTTPCTCANGVAGDGNSAPNTCQMGLRAKGGAGQPCLWWSQGCSINCEWCATNMTDGVIPTQAVTGNAPHTDKAGFRKSYCNSTLGHDKWTLPREAWTMNIHAVEGAEDDSYRYNPWRSPGAAPVVDPCTHHTRPISLAPATPSC